MPDIVTGIRIQRHNGGKVKIVTAAGAALFRIVGAAVTRADIDLVQLRVVGQSIPGRTAGTGFPVLAGPGFGRTHHRRVAGIFLRRAGHRIELPDLFTGLLIVGGDMPPDPGVAATVADHHLAVESPRRAGYGFGRLRGDRQCTPQQFTTARIQCQQTTIGGGRKDAAIGVGATAIQGKNIMHFLRCMFPHPGRVSPEQLTRTRIDSVDIRCGTGEIDNAVHLQRRGFQGLLPRQFQKPGEPQRPDVVAVYLLERAVATLVGAIPVTGPVHRCRRIRSVLERLRTTGEYQDPKDSGQYFYAVHYLSHKPGSLLF